MAKPLPTIALLIEGALGVVKPLLVMLDELLDESLLLPHAVRMHSEKNI